jgi:3-phosphoshikimate 1-carboxyvinyltransferase
MAETGDWIAAPGGPLRGTLSIPGDKSVSHRAVMLAAIADGVSRIDGFLEAADTRATAAIFRRLGVRIEAPGEGVRIVHGVGVDGLRPADGALDCGNAGTAMRLLAGLLSTQAFDSVLVGDASLGKRPMRRVTEPLAAMGALVETEDGHAPLRIHGGRELQGREHVLPVASAQVKSALLLAGLRSRGETLVREPRPTRDYTERMLAAFGVEVAHGPGWATVRGGQRLRATDLRVPADFSSAAFFIVAATLVPGSRLVLREVGVHPRRTGLLRVLAAMGADIELQPRGGEAGGEPLADIVVRHAPLRGIDVPAEVVPDMIDEFPALCIAAAAAGGPTPVPGGAERRVKESPPIAALGDGQ